MILHHLIRSPPPFLFEFNLISISAKEKEKEGNEILEFWKERGVKGGDTGAKRVEGGGVVVRKGGEERIGEIGEIERASYN